MAKTEEITIKTRAKAGKLAQRTTAHYTFAESLEEATEMYGANLCKLLINKAVKVGAQAAGRPLLEDSKSQEEIQAAVSAYRPEETSRRGRVKYITDMNSLKEQFATMPQEERQKMLALFEAYISGAEVPVATAGENGDDDEEENGDDDDEDGEPPSPTESPPSNINRRRPRSPRLTFE